MNFLLPSTLDLPYRASVNTCLVASIKTCLIASVNRGDEHECFAAHQLQFKERVDEHKLLLLLQLDHILKRCYRTEKSAKPAHNVRSKATFLAGSYRRYKPTQVEL
jgi:hypothetical protein